MFDSPTAILPYLEPPRIGATSLLARSIAKRLRCSVVAGYPEALPSSAQGEETGAEHDSEATAGPSGVGEDGAVEAGRGMAEMTLNHSSSSSTTPREQADGGGQVLPNSMKTLDGEALGVGYNSAVVVDPNGEVVGNYRKTFRFETDKNWAREGMSPRRSAKQDA